MAETQQKRYHHEIVSKNKQADIYLTMSSPISGVILMLLRLNLRVSDVEAPSDLLLHSNQGSIAVKQTFGLKKENNIQCLLHNYT